jgi:hypothetical protein
MSVEGPNRWPSRKQRSRRMLIAPSTVAPASRDPSAWVDRSSSPSSIADVPPRRLRHRVNGGRRPRASHSKMDRGRLPMRRKSAGEQTDSANKSLWRQEATSSTPGRGSRGEEPRTLPHPSRDRKSRSNVASSYFRSAVTLSIDPEIPPESAVNATTAVTAITARTTPYSASSDPPACASSPVRSRASR